MTTNIGSIGVGMNVNLAEFEAGLRKATELAGSQAQLMSAEMKRTSREGAESLRLIDEAIGVHISRPVTRILAQEFPALAQGLQSLLGAGVFGAVAIAGVEAFKKISESIDKAHEAEDKYAESSRHASETIETTLGGLRNKLAEISGDHVLKFAVQGAEEAKRAINEMSRAMQEAAKDAEKAGSFWTRFWSGVGNIAENVGRGASKLTNDFAASGPLTFFGLFGSSAKDSTQQIENMKDALKDMRTDLEIALNADAVKGTHTSLILLQNDVKAATAYLDDMKKAGDAAGKSLAQDAVDFFTNAKAAAELSKQIADTDAANAAQKQAEEQHKETVREFQLAAKDYNLAANALFEVMGAIDKAAGSALSDSANRFKELQKVYGSVVEVAPPPGAPQLADQAELDKISGTDVASQTEAWKKAGQVLASIETPAQKYAVQLEILQTLEDKGRISAQQMAEAHAKLDQEMLKDANHVHQMQEELQKLLERSDNASDGLKAFFLQLQINGAESGKFTFEILTKGLQGFNDEVVKGILTGKEHWKDYFRSLEEMALKFFLNRSEGSLILGLRQLFPDSTNPNANSTNASSSNGNALPGGITAAIAKSLLGQGSTTGSTALVTAAATLQSGATQLIAAATQLQAAATALSTNGVAGGGGLGEIFSGFPGFAGGTDDAPGGFSWVAEQGPELVNLPAGSSVTPMSSLRPGGGDQHFYIDAKGAELGVEEKIVRALQAAEPRFIGKALANFTEVQRRTAGQH